MNINQNIFGSCQLVHMQICKYYVMTYELRSMQSLIDCLVIHIDI